MNQSSSKNGIYFLLVSWLCYNIASWMRSFLSHSTALVSTACHVRISDFRMASRQPYHFQTCHEKQSRKFGRCGDGRELLCASSRTVIMKWGLCGLSPDENSLVCGEWCDCSCMYMGSLLGRSTLQHSPQELPTIYPSHFDALRKRRLFGLDSCRLLVAPLLGMTVCLLEGSTLTMWFFCLDVASHTDHLSSQRTDHFVY